MSINKDIDGPVRLESAVRAFRSYLQANGLRITAQRRTVLETCVRQAGHFDAEELQAELRKSDRAVSRATVYRTLSLLCEAGLLREVLRQDGRAFYETNLSGEHHDHMVCLRCGRVIEFCDERIERLQESICRWHGFEPRDHRMGIRGVCAGCKRDALKETD